MIGLLSALAVVFLGIVINSQLLIGFGFVALGIQLAFDYLKAGPKPVPQAGGKPAMKHKLIDAAQDAWEMPEDKTWMHMMAGPAPMVIGGHTDFLGNIAMGNFRNPHVSGAVRAMLPFSNYGRQGPLGAVEGLFVGFPISIGNFIRR